MKGHQARMIGAQPGKTGFRILAYISALLGLIGVVLPLLPTTPFMILAAYFASRGSPAFALWLDRHPTFGPAIGQWRERRAVPLKAKLLALSMMVLSWSMLLALGSPAPVLTISGLFLLAVAVCLISRPTC